MSALVALFSGASVSEACIRTSSHDYSNLDVTLIFALSLKNHGTAKAIRATARLIRDKVCREHRSKMAALARLENDEAVISCALNIVQRVTDMIGIHPGVAFTPKKAEVIELVQPPRCHMKPMRLAGYHNHRHWKCQHCKHTKPMNWNKPQGEEGTC